MIIGNQCDDIENKLSLLTVIVPTFNRQKYLKRVCTYWKNSGVRLIIIDGSLNSYASELKEILLQNSNIQYIHCVEKFNLRLNHASAYINTPYAVHAADDEFLTFSGLASAIKLLEENNDLVACGGQTIKFNPFRTRNKIDYGEGYKTFGYNVLQNSIYDRLSFISKNYKPVTFYAVMKAEIWKKAWGNMNCSDVAMVLEFEQIFTTFVCGKVVTLDEVVRLWSLEELPTSDPKLNRVTKLEDWWKDPNYFEERELFVNKIASEICRNEFMDIRQATEIVIESMENYCLNPLNFNPTPKKFIPKLRKLCKDYIKKSVSHKKLQLLKLFRNTFLYLTVNRINYLWPKLEYGSLYEMIERRDQLPFLMNDNLIEDLKFIETSVYEYYK